MSATPRQPEDATLLMNAIASGDGSAADRLLPLVYEQLRKSAQLNLASERAGHTLSATALVHEAYLRLVGPREVPWDGRRHFYTAAAEAMRRNGAAGAASLAVGLLGIVDLRTMPGAV